MQLKHGLLQVLPACLVALRQSGSVGSFSSRAGGAAPNGDTRSVFARLDTESHDLQLAVPNTGQRPCSNGARKASAEQVSGEVIEKTEESP